MNHDVSQSCSSSGPVGRPDLIIATVLPTYSSPARPHRSLGTRLHHGKVTSEPVI